MRLRLVLVAVLAASLARGETAAPHGAPLLWRVERNGRISHLFATVHVGLDLDAALQDVGRRALDSATRVYVEADLTSPETIMQVLHDTLARAELPPDRSLRAMLTPKAWAELTALQRGNISPAVLDRMEPWFAVMAGLRAKVPTEPARLHRVPPPVLDAAIAARAKARGIRVVQLETPLDGLEGFISIGRREATRMLEELLAHPDSPDHDVEGLVGAYAAANDRQVLKAFGRLWRRRPTLAEQILFRRNERWCERLVLWLGDGNIFVAAGTFHMFGDRGLVELLRRRGYHVERMRADPTPPAAGTLPSAGSGNDARRPAPRAAEDEVSQRLSLSGTQVALFQRLGQPARIAQVSDGDRGPRLGPLRDGIQLARALRNDPDHLMHVKPASRRFDE